VQAAYRSAANASAITTSADVTIGRGIRLRDHHAADPVQLAGFIDDQPATEVHDDLEVRALFLRGSTVVYACCLRLAGFVAQVRKSGALMPSRRRSTSTARSADVVHHTHAGPSTLEGRHLSRLDNPDGYLETLVQRCVARRSRREGRRGSGHVARRPWPLPAGLSINGAACRMSRRSRSST